jgi:hypothetical protein
MQTIELGPERIKIKAPASPSTALSIVRMLENSPEFAGGAALAVCAPALARKAGIKINYGDLYETGREMFDFVVAQLMRGGMSGTEAMEGAARAGGEATVAILGQLPTESEVEEVKKD